MNDEERIKQLVKFESDVVNGDADGVRVRAWRDGKAGGL